MDKEKNQKDTKKQEAEKVSPSQVTSSGVQTQATGSSSEGTSGGGNNTMKILLGCFIFLLVCCCCSIFGFWFLAQQGSGLVASSLGGEGRDDSLTRIERSEIDQIVGQQEVDSQGDVQPEEIGETRQENGNTVVTLTEEEVLALILLESDQTFDADSIGIDIEPGTMVFEVDLATALVALENSSQTQDINTIDPTLVEGLVFRVELATENDLLVVRRVSTGSPIVDNFIPQDVNAEIASELNRSLQVEKIEFGQDQVEITIAPNNLRQ